MEMKAIFLSAALVAPLLASAACVGTGAYQTCYDNSGNTYNVQRIGNTTYVDGNSGAGKSWSQTSQTIGNTTYHDGRAANGNSWSGTSTTIGGTTFHDGVDSRGKSYSGSSYGSHGSPAFGGDDD